MLKKEITVNPSIGGSSRDFYLSISQKERRAQIWFNNSRAVLDQDSNLTIYFPSKFMVEHVQKNIGDSVSLVAKSLGAEQIKYEIDATLKERVYTWRNEKEMIKEPAESNYKRSFNQAYDRTKPFLSYPDALDNFIVHDGNEMALKQLDMIVQGEQFKPLLIYGPNSSGKTSVLARTIKGLDEKRIPVYYLDVSLLAEQLRKSRGEDPKGFHSYGSAQYIFIDELKAIFGADGKSNRVGTQQRVKTILDMAQQTKKNIVLSFTGSLKDYWAAIYHLQDGKPDENRCVGNKDLGSRLEGVSHVEVKAPNQRRQFLVELILHDFSFQVLLLRIKILIGVKTELLEV